MSESTAVVEHQHITDHEVESAVKRSKSGKGPSFQIKCTKQVNMKWLED